MPSIYIYIYIYIYDISSLRVNSVHFRRSSAFHQPVRQHTISRLCTKFVSYYSQHPSCIRSSFSSSKYKLISSKYNLSFPFNPPPLLLLLLLLGLEHMPSDAPQPIGLLCESPPSSIRCPVLSACASRLTVRWSMYFVSFWLSFFFNDIAANSLNSLVHSPGSYCY